MMLLTGKTGRKDRLESPARAAHYKGEVIGSTSVAADVSLSISHEVFVPREIVFELWTTPDHLMCWYSPGEGYERRVEIDLRVGGDMRFAWSKPDRESVSQTGRIIEVDPPVRFVYDVILRDSVSTRPNRVTIDFLDLGGRTRIDIYQEGLESEAMRERQIERWGLIFEQLENYLSSI